jgi:hypothetical protein
MRSSRKEDPRTSDMAIGGIIWTVDATLRVFPGTKQQNPHSHQSEAVRASIFDVAGSFRSAIHNYRAASVGRKDSTIWTHRQSAWIIQLKRDGARNTADAKLAFHSSEPTGRLTTDTPRSREFVIYGKYVGTDLQIPENHLAVRRFSRHRSSRSRHSQTLGGKSDLHSVNYLVTCMTHSGAC